MDLGVIGFVAGLVVLGIYWTRRKSQRGGILSRVYGGLKLGGDTGIQQIWKHPAILALLGYLFVLLAIEFLLPSGVSGYWWNTNTWWALLIFVPLLALTFTQKSRAARFLGVVVGLIFLAGAVFDLTDYMAKLETANGREKTAVVTVMNTVEPPIGVWQSYDLPPGKTFTIITPPGTQFASGGGTPEGCYLWWNTGEKKLYCTPGAKPDPTLKPEVLPEATSGGSGRGLHFNILALNSKMTYQVKLEPIP